MNVSPFALVAWLTSAAAALAQGYAGLGTAAPGFVRPDPATRLTFPADDGPHPGFRVEWWYLTATLTDTTGAPLGVQWTLFRTALAAEPGDGWQSNEVWMGHAAVTTANTHRFAETFARGGTGQAGARPSPFAAWIDDWEMAEGEAAWTLTARGADFAIDLTLSGRFDPVLHGAEGYSVKSASGHASHYFSRPFLTATGTVMLDGAPRAVSGQAWLDREWSSQLLSGDQSGWDWAGLKLDDGRRLMVARVRDGGGDFRFGTLIAADGTPDALGQTEVAMTPLDRKEPPSRWAIALPGHGIDLTIEALNPDARTGTLFSYWEGPVTVTGSHSGRGYLEMTGRP